MNEVLRITVVGMGLVFAAMALVLGAMLLLARLRDPEPAHEAAETAAEGSPRDDERAIKLRVAMIAAAIARAQAIGTPQMPATSNAPSPWWLQHHAQRLARKQQ